MATTSLAAAQMELSRLKRAPVSAEAYELVEQTTRAIGSSTRVDGVENMVERSTIFHGINEAAFILGQNFVSGRYLGIGRHDLKC